MKRLLHLLRQFFGQQPEPDPIAAPRVAEWTDTDRDHWRHFLQGSTGQRFLARLRAVECLNALAGAQDVMHTAHSAGRSAGFSDCISHIISLSCTRHGKRDTDSGAPGEALADETPEQTEAREMAELLARHSP